MVYSTGIASPAFVEFMSGMGATDMHFGLLGGIPMIMLSMQFVGAVITNVVRRRKPLFMVSSMVGRFLYVPLSLIPLLFPSVRSSVAVAWSLALIALSGAVTNLAVPLWMSWMADLIPRRVLNTYWGRRQRWMFLTWTVSFLAVAVFTRWTGLPILKSFPIMAGLAVVAGIVDVLLFLWIREPRNAVSRGNPVLRAMLEPLRNADYRPFVVYACVWTFSAMFCGAFMQVYVLKAIGLSVWQTTLIWCAYGIGIALASSAWGKVADAHGHRPVLVVCVAFRAVIVLALLLVDRSSALWVLPLAVLIDSIWDGGLIIATNGYMLKIAPRQNRSMFIAAISGLAGLCGGLGSMAGGGFLKLAEGFAFEAMGRGWTNYHLLFLVNIAMRLGCIGLALKVREPKASTPEKLLHQLRGTWPMSFLLFPIGLYRKASGRLDGWRNAIGM